MPVNHVKEYLISVHTSVVFSHFYVRASNGSHYSNFGNKCPKLGTDTPEDMLFGKFTMLGPRICLESILVEPSFAQQSPNQNEWEIKRDFHQENETAGD